MVCLHRSYPLKYFKDSFPQVLIGPFLNAVYDIFLSHYTMFAPIVVWLTPPDIPNTPQNFINTI